MGVERIGRLRRFLSLGQGLKSGLGSRVGEFAERLDDHAEALALAEAGELALAGQAVTRLGKGRKRIIVLGGRRGYPARLADYALGLGERLGFGLVFLLASGNGAGCLGPDRAEDVRREAFFRQAADAARPWMSRALGLGLEVGHLVHFGPPDEAVRVVGRSLRRVELILCGPENVKCLRETAQAAVFTVY